MGVTPDPVSLPWSSWAQIQSVPGTAVAGGGEVPGAAPVREAAPEPWAQAATVSVARADAMT